MQLILIDTPALQAYIVRIHIQHKFKHYSRIDTNEPQDGSVSLRSSPKPRAELSSSLLN